MGRKIYNRHFASTTLKTLVGNAAFNSSCIADISDNIAELLLSLDGFSEVGIGSVFVIERLITGGTTIGAKRFVTASGGFPDAGGACIGVTLGPAIQGTVLPIATAGTAIVIAGGTVTAQDLITPTAAGAGIKASGTDFIAGQALTSASDGEAFMINLWAGGAGGASASAASKAFTVTVNEVEDDFTFPDPLPDGYSYDVLIVSQLGTDGETKLVDINTVTKTGFKASAPEDGVVLVGVPVYYETPS